MSDQEILEDWDIEEGPGIWAIVNETLVWFADQAAPHKTTPPTETV